MPDYSKGKIYQILNNVDNDVYVGSTCVPLAKRLWKHKWEFENRQFIDRPLTNKMKLLGVDAFYIELVENTPCNSKEELRAREGFYIRQRGTLNKMTAGKTRKEWREEHRDYLKQKARAYYYQHHEEELQKRKERRDVNRTYMNETIQCDNCGAEVVRQGMSRHKKTNKCKTRVKPSDTSTTAECT